MRLFLAVVLWFILLAVCWPLALLLLLLFPLIWLFVLPFRIIGFTFELAFRFIRALILFPFRVVGVRA